ncbi:hypothetical protein ACGFY3_32065 [Streptomyces mirabilis]|uniref:hypothetical protein n=1 Tax=Streptomyces mirabilis TaxID=68239 RepID=UPI003710A32A
MKQLLNDLSTVPIDDVLDSTEQHPFRPFSAASTPVHLVYRLYVSHGRRGEPKTFAWDGYHNLILGTPLVWCWGNLNVHLDQRLADSPRSTGNGYGSSRYRRTQPS